jgi:hypothetical protein
MIKEKQNIFKKLVKLRNPWGRENGGWTGDWSPDFKGWTSNLRT